MDKRLIQMTLMAHYTQHLKKKLQNSSCQNFIKLPSTLITWAQRWQKG